MESECVTVLVVEDEKLHAGAITRAFRSGTDSVKTVVASNLKEAYEYLEKSTPDIVISDWLLPDGKGSELLRIEDEVPAYPVILMTSHGSEEVAVEAMRAGASDYVVKSDTVFADMPHIVRRALREYGHIVERNKAQQALKESERFLSTILDSIQDGLTVTDRYYNILRVNRAMELRYAHVMPLVRNVIRHTKAAVNRANDAPSEKPCKRGNPVMLRYPCQENPEKCRVGSIYTRFLLSTLRQAR